MPRPMVPCLLLATLLAACGGEGMDPLPGAGAVLHEADAGPRAALPISPQGEGEILGPHAWDDFTNPMLVLTGTNDESSRSGNDWTWRLDPYTHAPPGSRHLVVVRDAYHDFGGISGAMYPGQGPPHEDQVRTVRPVATAFFDAYVRDDEAAGAWLSSNAIAEATGGAVDVDWK